MFSTKKLFFVVIGLFVVLGALGFWYSQRNSFSKDLLKFEILAPKDTGMGQEITYVVQWKNNSQLLLENPSLSFEYPQGSLPSDGGLTRVTKKLDDIYPGQEKTLTFKARLFGAQGDAKQAKAYLSYNPKNLEARYENDTTSTTIISSVPLSFDLDLPSHTESGQALTFTLNYFSNSDFPLSNTRIKIDYPDGFAFQSASPAPIGPNEWAIGVLNKGQGGRITIRGTLQGQLQEAKNFHATFGSWNTGEFTLFREVTRAIEIAQPQIEISQTVNGETGKSVSPGDLLHYEISFKNVSDKDLEGLFLAVNLQGDLFDYASINVPVGTFHAGDHSIVWEAQDSASLRVLSIGDEGQVEFWIRVKGAADSSSRVPNATLQDSVSLSSASETFSLKVNSKLVIRQSGYFQDEVFGNTGVLPPVAGTKTTYTIIWKAQSLYNDVKNAKVKATLPSNVELTGKIFPEGASLTFDSKSREIVWTIGDMQAGTGASLAAASVAFQIALSPSAAQRGAVAQLMGAPRITADDTWTIQAISGSDSALDTSIPDDTSSAGKGIVQ